MHNNFYTIKEHIDTLTEEYSLVNFEAAEQYFNEEGIFDYFIKKISKTLNTDWLVPLKDKGFFDPAKNLPPEELPDKKGYFSIPYWNVLNYLEVISRENSKNSKEHITKALNEIVNKVIAKRVDNYRTDWVMLTVMSTLPTNLLTDTHIEFIKASLQSTFKSTLVESDLGKLLIPKLIKDKTVNLLLKLIDVMLDYKKREDKLGSEVISIMDPYWLAEALREHKPDIAKLCGIEAAGIAISKIENILAEDNNSFIYRIPTIEDHPQIISPEHYECQVVQFVRDMFEYYPDPEAIREEVKSLLGKEHPIFKRLAFHLINKKYRSLKTLFWECDDNPLDVSVEHEIYELLKNHCKEFSNAEIDKLLDWIETEKYPLHKEEIDEEKHKKHRARRKKEWLSALEQIKNTNEKILHKYDQYNEIFPHEIDHPGFTSWFDSGFVRDESPITIEELCSKTNQNIAKYLSEFKDEGKFDWGKQADISIKNIFNACVTSKPEKFSKELDPFLDVQPIYILRLLWGLTEVWRNKEDFKWDEILEFIWKLIEPESFWQENERSNDRSSIIRAISDLLEEGTKNDAHAFNPDHLPYAEKILLRLLDKTNSDLQSINDYATSVLNSAKGKIYTALINYSLRFARLYKRSETNRWKIEIKNEFTRRLDRKIESTPEYSVILGQYIANIHYLDKKWVEENIEKIFLKDNSIHWEATMTGYLYYANKVYKEIYNLLVKNEQYEKAIHATFRDKFATERLVQHISIGFIEGWESLEDDSSLISKVLSNGNSDQLRELIEFIWTLREKLKADQKNKVKQLWGKLMNTISDKVGETDYQSLTSNLSRWLILVDEIDDEIYKWMKQAVKYFDKDHFTNNFIVEYLLKHIEKTPQKVGEIYIEMLSNGVYPLYKDEQIKELVRKLYSTNQDIADKICNMYGSKGHVEILEDVYKEHHAI